MFKHVYCDTLQLHNRFKLYSKERWMQCGHRQTAPKKGTPHIAYMYNVNATHATADHTETPAVIAHIKGLHGPSTITSIFYSSP